eukprot:TRINITY_DN35412_c0_g1_i1.p1 TRINITY_DN35412_c0_g1~~TRINITY_DN35412_c0_g1_i1.p1  ORF type:complete len:492 (-),score=36.89 TRINITY_DN35412_c0_g1_i1:922-2397(-)
MAAFQTVSGRHPPIHAVNIGEPGSLKFRLLFTDGQFLLSPLHDIPLITPHGRFSFVCTTPAGSWVKYGVATEPSHPLCVLATPESAEVQARTYSALENTTLPITGMLDELPDILKAQTPLRLSLDNGCEPADSPVFAASFQGASSGSCSSLSSSDGSFPYTRSAHTSQGASEKHASTAASPCSAPDGKSHWPASSEGFAKTIPQDFSDRTGLPAHFLDNCPWSLGFLPQTTVPAPRPGFSNNHIESQACGDEQSEKSDYIAEPRSLQVIDISHEKERQPGSVYDVKPLGAFSRSTREGIDQWLLICIAMDDPMAALMEDGEDLEAELPGTLEMVRAWIEEEDVMPDTASGSCLQLETQLAFATSKICKCHEEWRTRFEAATRRTAPVLLPSRDRNYLARVWEIYMQEASSRSIPLTRKGTSRLVYDSSWFDHPLPKVAAAFPPRPALTRSSTTHEPSFGSHKKDLRQFWRRGSSSEVRYVRGKMDLIAKSS